MSAGGAPLWLVSERSPFVVYDVRMTISISSTALDNPGGVRLALASVTFDSSYPTGGEAIAASDFGFDRILAVLPLGPTTNGKTVRPTNVYDKLQVFESGGGSVARIGTGAAAGNVTVTGVAATDTIESVILLCDSATVALDLTSEFAVCATNTIGNAAGTSTAGGKVLARTLTAGQRAKEVANTTDLSAEIVQVLVIGQVY